MGPLKVLHHSPWQTECGIAQYTEQLIQSLERLGVAGSVHPIDTAALPNLSDSEMLSRLGKLVDEARQHDVLHIQHAYSFFANGPYVLRRVNKNFMGLLQGLADARVPTVVTLHVEPQGTESWNVGRRLRVGRFLGEKLRRKSSLYFHHWRMPAALRSDPDRFRAVTFSPRQQLTYVNTGLDPAVMRVIPLAAPRGCREVSELQTQAAKERLGLPRDCTLLSQFGFIFAHKGCEAAVRAMELLPENYFLAIVGGRHRDTPGEPTLNRILEIWQGRDPERLRVTGFVSDEERDLYHAATDICLAPYSMQELTASGAITWALTSGKPVIASTIPAFREIANAYDCMLSVPPGMIHELAWQIRRLATSPQLRQQLTRGALRYAQDHSWEVTAQRYATQFTELVAAKQTAAASPPGKLTWPRAA
jgi:glycosyltransferase involved in cell wall biosynthesis